MPKLAKIKKCLNWSDRKIKSKQVQLNLQEIRKKCSVLLFAKNEIFDLEKN